LATTVYDIVEIQLGDGSSLTLKPLPIKQLRKFMDVIKTMEDAEDATEESAMDVFIQASMICMAGLGRADLSTDRDKFEEVIEIPTMMKILEVAGGLKLTDPNLLGAALVGTN
jgi:hypothetical protein